MHLPCRHVFAVRERKGLPLFIDNIIADRWTLDHMKSTYDQKIHDLHPDSFQVCCYSAVP